MTQGIFTHIEAEGIDAKAPTLHRHKRVIDNAATIAVSGMYTKTIIYSQSTLSRARRWAAGEYVPL